LRKISTHETDILFTAALVAHVGGV
jgi:hypothetical protein